MVTLIAAASDNHALGKQNQLLWHLPDDFKRFKEKTSGHFIVMGRKTFDSLPKRLPNRTHIIITRQKDYVVADCLIAHSLSEALAMCPKNEEVYIIGGAEIYKQALENADKIELTRVHHIFDADAFFPEINPSEWELVFEERHDRDDKHLFDYTFQTFKKI
ncbi:dihydrofolate reductase [Flavobacterium aciduliphilum]|uniref:Dihydrofolate reductase n=1 Tax=Flavobacterium aciduliphilum TaxID=1101402 RepID=A0A328YPP5_9FLAO|nr:dihydrofolate reductase [Flavobacterium aciduliphilum]RAR74132.1 dihydrofolate reductase [Flavobacterium aciduliphilum]